MMVKVSQIRTATCLQSVVETENRPFSLRLVQIIERIDLCVRSFVLRELRIRINFSKHFFETSMLR